MKFPCIVCSLEVRPRQQAVECDLCSRWQHRTCNTGISVATYREAVRQGGVTFVCRPCLDKEDLTSSNEAVPHADAEAVVDEVSNDPPFLELRVGITGLTKKPVRRVCPSTNSSLS